MPKRDRRGWFADTSLLVRTNLIVGSSVALIALIATASLYSFVIEPISRRSADDAAALVVLAAQTWVELPPAARPFFELEMAESHDLILSADVRDLPEATAIDGFATLLRERLEERLDIDLRLLAADDLLWANVPMAEVVLQTGFAPGFGAVQPLFPAVIITVVGVLVVLLTSLLLTRRITRPLVQAAKRAETFRGASDFEPLPEEGPRELVSLARNFNTMARDIAALLANRTTLLAGVSHDLRTPLTRMRLALELLPETVEEDLRLRLDRNLTNMEALINDALQLARGTHEKPEPLDLARLLPELLSRYEPAPCLRIVQSRRIDAPPGALQRVLGNLIDNAVQHGQEVEVQLDGLTIEVRDRGPGIPEAEREQVFQPFYRLDRSRSVVTGGSGLGLAIARQLCDTHGWLVRLEANPGGGTRAVLDLVPGRLKGSSTVSPAS
ncbi:MAG: HAMP domain-containing sensor histidine kinase [Pseudomonadota bacterium]